MKRAARIAGFTLLALIVLFAAGVLWPVRPAPLAPGLRSHAITNVHVVDVRSGVASGPSDVVIRDGRVASIGGPAPAGLHRIDGRGGYLIPGLWDMHSHNWQVSPQLHFPLHIANGVVAVRDMMDCPGATDSLIACVADKRRWSEAADSGEMVAPRFIGVASFYFESADLAPESATARVRDYQRRGIDYIKVYNSLSMESYRAVADEAARLGMPVVGHLPKKVALTEAMELGQQSFEHARVLVHACSSRSDEWAAGRLDGLAPVARDRLFVETFDAARCGGLLANMRRRDLWFVPTHLTRQDDLIAAKGQEMDDPRLDYLDPLSRWAFGDDAAGTRAAYPGREGQRVLQSYFDHGLRLTGAAHKAGVRVLAGTDTILSGFKLHDELGLLVRAGLTPAQALRAATLDAAEYAGLGHESGSVDPRKRADFILLRANPLQAISNTRAIEAVFVGGRHYDRQHLDALLSYTRKQANHPANWIKMLWGFAMSSVSGEL